MERLSTAVGSEQAVYCSMYYAFFHYLRIVPVSDEFGCHVQKIVPFGFTLFDMSRNGNMFLSLVVSNVNLRFGWRLLSASNSSFVSPLTVLTISLTYLRKNLILDEWLMSVLSFSRQNEHIQTWFSILSCSALLIDASLAVISGNLWMKLWEPHLKLQTPKCKTNTQISTCRNCQHRVTAGFKGVGCEICNRLLHAKCQQISNTEHDSMENQFCMYSFCRENDKNDINHSSETNFFSEMSNIL